MIYTSIVSLLIEKPFYLLRSQSFSFQVESEFIDTVVGFSNFRSRRWGFCSLFCPKGRVFVHIDCLWGRIYAPFEECPGFFRGWGMVLDEIDSCIIKEL